MIYQGIRELRYLMLAAAFEKNKILPDGSETFVKVIYMNRYFLYDQNSCICQDNLTYII